MKNERKKFMEICNDFSHCEIAVKNSSYDKQKQQFYIAELATMKTMLSILFDCKYDEVSTKVHDYIENNYWKRR